MAPTKPAASSTASNLPDGTHTNVITLDEAPGRIQDTVGAATKSSDAPRSTRHHTAVDTPDEPQTTAETGAAMEAEWSGMTIDEKLAIMDARNKAFAVESRKPEGQREPTPEPGPVHEDDQELFEKLDKRMAALKLQVENLSKSLRETKDGSVETGDS
jgi:hypothetical protein